MQQEHQKHDSLLRELEQLRMENALGFYSDKDNIIKLKDDRIAAEMLNVLFG